MLYMAEFQWFEQNWLKILASLDLLPKFNKMLHKIFSPLDAFWKGHGSRVRVLNLTETLLSLYKEMFYS